MVTVEADLVVVESRLAGGQVRCPGCPGALRPWGWARARRIVGLGESLRPRRGRCGSCRVTHVLLPVTVLARRGYAAVLVWAALVGRGGGAGHRKVAEAVGVPETTVRGWLRRMAARLGSVRELFVAVAVRVGVDVAVPDGLGCPWRDLLGAVGAAVTAVRWRFGDAGLAGTVTPAQVVAAVSGGRLLAPGWPGTGIQHQFTLPPDRAAG